MHELTQTDRCAPDSRENPPVQLTLQTPAADPRLWLLEPHLAFLNHGSFGSCPRTVLDFQQQIRYRLERQPVQFFVRDLEPLLDNARATLARFIGAEVDNLVFVNNATTGVNTVLRSLRFEPGDELLVTDHEYNACRNALDHTASLTRASIRVVQVPFPTNSAAELLQRILSGVTPQTKLVLLDHVTSQTGLVLPIQQLVRSVRELGIDTLVDGAHAPGMVALNLEEIGSSYYTGNCHKWICAPKGAGFLYVRPDRQHLIRPLSISHGANSPRKDRSRFLIEFGWAGTWDPSAYLSVPEAIRFMDSVVPGGWSEIMRRNHQLAMEGRRILCGALGIAAPCPDDLLGSLASLPLPDSNSSSAPVSPLYLDPLQDQLLRDYEIEVPIIPWPAPPRRLVRISAQLYNSLPQYEALAGALKKVLS